MANNTSGHYVWTDVFVKRHWRWQAVNSQDTLMPQKQVSASTPASTSEAARLILLASRGSAALCRNHRQLEVRRIPSVVIDRLFCYHDPWIHSQLPAII